MSFNFDTAVHSETKRNNLAAYCPHCGCKMIPENAAIYKNEAKTLVDGNDFVEYKHFWFITNQFDFDNIGISKPVEGSQHRYLICADCEQGSFGLYFPSSSEFYLSCEKVSYTAPEKRPISFNSDLLAAFINSNNLLQQSEQQNEQQNKQQD